ncbi:MAG: S8 family serine peptidase [Elusimicrobiales bacterium]|nr:S8 family serine peptidase [Elusimicrobiales bacterium]
MRHQIMLVLTVLLAPGFSVAQAGRAPIASDFTDQIIVKFKTAGTKNSAPLSVKRLADLSAAAGKPLSHKRAMSGRAEVLRLGSKLRIEEVAAAAARLRAQPDIEYAEPDRIARPQALPNDTSFGGQWHYLGPVDGEPGGANLPQAWDITTGATNIVVAVIDTGILSHEDLDPVRVLPGYDMIADADKSNDGDGRDADPSDPGDWAPADYCYPGSPATDSTWHGTHVAGTIGAATNNNLGVAGVNWNSKILPVRVLGDCGGYDSDIIDGIRWSAGLPVPGVPNNPNPAKIINMSLGGEGECGKAYQSAIGEAIAAGAAIIVAAGNENMNASRSNPANCDGVLTVGAVNRAGGRASYSNYGTTVDISAPGGEGEGLGIGVLSTHNDGLTAPGNAIYKANPGTSMATPHVAGIASLMVSVNPSLSPAQISAILKSTARSFPTGTGSDCSTSLCGAGIVDAKAALLFVSQNSTGPALKDLKAYPNPVYFNSAEFVTIAGIPADATDVKVYIYNTAGELVRTLRPGSGLVHMPYWDGKTEGGKKAASGLYVYLAKTGNYGKGTGKFYVFW